MRVTVLTDNTAGGICLAEHGLSFLIEHDTRVLLDAGRTDVFLTNARQLGCNLETVRDVVLSHGHFDHGDGLMSVPGERKRLICHPEAFKPCLSKKGGRQVGLRHSRETLARKFDVSVHADPFRIAERTVFLGTVPRTNDFEAQDTPFADADGNDDFMPDDSALAMVTDKGLVVISGCAHAGICNTVEHAVRVTGEERIQTVMGGFHLKNDDELTRQTITFLQGRRVKTVLPSHCTALPALAAFHRAFGNPQVTAGMVLEL